MTDERIARFDREELERLTVERSLGTRHEKQIYCANPDCSTRAAGTMFPIVGDGVHTWEVLDGHGLDSNGRRHRIQGDLVPDGEPWLCGDCRT